jgi:spermidine synthase
MTNERLHRARAGLPWLMGFGLLAFGLWFALSSGEGGRRGDLEEEIKSDYSRMRIRKVHNVRTLSFVRDSGEEVTESQVNLEKPYDLLIDYTRFMFLSYVFRPKQEKVLIVGLGGGAMVHFMKHYDPKAKIDVVEIDPVIVSVADKYFGVKTAGNVTIHTKDGFEYLKNTDATYDVIYMDAFLKPARDTDPTGVPLRLKTVRFYKDIQKKLSPDGLVVFNINPHAHIEDDVKNIRDAFPQTYVFHLPDYGGLVVVGSMATKRIDNRSVIAAAAELDRRFRTSYSFREMAMRLER